MSEQSNFIIRSARFDDLEELNEMMYDLHDEHHQIAPELFKPAEHIEKSIAHYLEHPECLVYVAMCDDHVVGFVSGYFGQYQSPVSQPVLMGSADELYVDVQHRKGGIAQALMKRIECEFRDYGAKFMFVEVWDKNQAAVSFYRQFGFENHIHCLVKPLTEKN
ncbi:GNAT family N-acetyltransferase [Vibrio astriarenae]|uniref:GNAT family N-acetyltransferase n=1 Tax=Vibrio astriarenae TaxID=1481923 RepID=A0A7Z2T2Z2_9VIBR|nr:GNAT family N-acetyltransferase [Vibrio astriarenae]QIA63404.1 GNAT family N-acetyltransferase [Vibrio astriarenae]